MTFGGCLTTKNARSRHEINFGGSIGTMWSEKSCCILVQSGANNSTHSSLISGLVFLLVNFQKFENCLKTVMFRLSYLPPKAIYDQKIASSIHLLKILLIIGEIISTEILIIFIGIQFDFVAFFGLSSRIYFLTSRGVKAFRKKESFI